MDKKIINDGQFLYCDNSEYGCYFSTAEFGKTYGIKDGGLNDKLRKISDELGLDDIVYLQQIHSDIIYEYDGTHKFRGDVEGDAIITDIKNVGIGVFTADCVPVIVVDSKKHVCAAIHSGWKGTINNIVGKTISKMVNEYGCSTDDMDVFIGPHNKVCCYEVSTELIEKFSNNEIFSGKNINEGRYLNLEQCIVIQCQEESINLNNINRDKYCTFCSKEPIFHSYRKDKDLAGRQISFVYIK